MCWIGTLGFPRDGLSGFRAVEPLITALKDAEGIVRMAAAEALGRIGDPRATEPLRAALEDKHGTVRRNAQKALDKLSGAKVQQE